MPTLARPRVENRTPEDLVNDVRSGLIRLRFDRGGATFQYERFPELAVHYTQRLSQLPLTRTA
jgi:hypothetical protein